MLVTPESWEIHCKRPKHLLTFTTGFIRSRKWYFVSSLITPADWTLFLFLWSSSNRLTKILQWSRAQNTSMGLAQLFLSFGGLALQRIQWPQQGLWFKLFEIQQARHRRGCKGGSETDKWESSEMWVKVAHAHLNRVFPGFLIAVVEKKILLQSPRCNQGPNENHLAVMYFDGSFFW